jgi:hypothetical protein
MRQESDETVQITLGAGGTGNLRVTVTGDRGPVVTTTPDYSGFMHFVVLHVEPVRAGISYPFLLNDFVQIDEPGNYRLSIQIDDGGGWSAVTEFCVLPDTESSRIQLQERYSGFLKKWNTVESSERTMVRNAIFLSKHALAFESQRKLLYRGGWENKKEFEGLIDSMVLSRSQEAAQSLIEAVLANPKTSAMEKSIVLNRLREAHVEKWKKPVYDLLQPYRDAIKNSVPMVISD